MLHLPGHHAWLVVKILRKRAKALSQNYSAKFEELEGRLLVITINV